MNGDVDWKTLGNILVAHLLGEVIKILNSLSNLPLGRHDGSTGAWIFWLGYTCTEPYNTDSLKGGVLISGLNYWAAIKLQQRCLPYYYYGRNQ